MDFLTYRQMFIFINSSTFLSFSFHSNRLEQKIFEQNEFKEIIFLNEENISKKNVIVRTER